MGCSGDETVTMDSSSPSDSATAGDVATDVPADVPADVAADVAADVSADVLVDTGPVARCGWSDSGDAFTCGGTDAPPFDVVCTGTNCCIGPCTTDRAASCCDTATGIVTTETYGGGDCHLETITCAE